MNTHRMIQEAQHVRNVCLGLLVPQVVVVAWGAWAKEPITLGAGLFVAGLTALTVLAKHKTISRHIDDEVIHDVMSS